MNRNYRIGVFDSGVGGLEMLEHLNRLLPNEKMYYFADTVNNPYGEKSAAQIEQFLSDIVEGMLMRRVKLLIIACHTASTVFRSLPASHELRQRLHKHGVDVLPIASPEALSELTFTAPSRLLITGTRLTIDSGLYQKLAAELLPNCKLHTLAAPEWVQRVERPETDADLERRLRMETLQKDLAPFMEQPPDAVFLGCTHFPRLAEEIRQVLGNGVRLINPALSLAQFARAYLDIRNLRADADNRAASDEQVVFTNGSEQAISAQLARMGVNGRLRVRQVDIRNDLSGKAVDVVGYGVTGQSLLRHLRRHRPSLIRVRDSRPVVAEKLKEDFPDLSAQAVTGEQYLDDLHRADVVFRSPGVPADLPAFRQTRRMGVPIMSDVELFLQHAKGRKVAISGTNGKTTTTILTQRLFAGDIGEDAHLMGNIGRPVLDILPDLNDNSVCAMELSSFQLEELSSLPVQASILLNITPDHLDRHGDMAGYIAAKGRIFTLLEKNSYAIYNIESEPIVNELLPKGCAAAMVPFSTRRELERGAFLQGTDLVMRHPDRDVLCIEDFMQQRRFVGEHNLENLMASGLAAFLLGVSPDVIEETLRSFAGVVYRVERFHRMNGVDYYDDSKGTNPDATIKALQSLNNPILLVAGGNNKGLCFDETAQACSGRVSKAFLFGEITEALSEALNKLSSPIPIQSCTDLEDAARQAVMQAQPGMDVLFSPASASPAGEKYYQRGDRFKAAIRALGTDELPPGAHYLPDPLADKH